jgi:excisionase family DNA binding protein
METISSEQPGGFVPNSADAALAREAVPRLAHVLSVAENGPLSVQISAMHGAEERPILLPASAVELLGNILKEMAKGNAVTLIPTDAELTLQQAADLLNVSRQFLIEQLDKGTIPSCDSAPPRRVRFEDLMAYKQAMDRNRRQALDELAAQGQELGMGY